MDIQQLANEFSELKKYEYKLLLETNEIVNFTFNESDFYHLLGFEKFQDVTIVKMIESRKYTKRNFYKEVLKGNITYNNITIPIKNIDDFKQDGEIIHFCDATRTDKVKHVLNNRFPYFSFNNIERLISSNLIVLYDKSKANEWNKIQADKFFFELLLPEDKNLCFFIRKSEEKSCECPVSFFLEQIKGSYIKTNNNCDELEQKKAKILYKLIHKKGEINNIYSFNIFWENVRESNNTLDEFKAQKRLQEYYSGKVVKSKKVKIDLEYMKNELDTYKKELNKLINLKEKETLINDYISENDEDSKLEIAIKLLEIYNIDIEKDKIFEKDLLDINNKINCYKQKITTLNKKIKKYIKFLPILEELEVKDVKKAYNSLVKDIELYENKFIRFLIDSKDVLNNNLEPNVIKAEYINWKNKSLLY